jgi:hypothetical protein
LHFLIIIHVAAQKNKLTIIDNGFVLEHNKIFGVAKCMGFFFGEGSVLFLPTLVSFEKHHPN